MDLHAIFFKSKELNILELFIRASVLYFILFASAKTLGFRQPGIITPYNFLMAAGVSHIAAARMVNPESRLIDAISIIIVYTMIHILFSYLYLKSPRIIGQDSKILINKGKIIKKNLDKSKLTIDNVFSILRQKDAFNLEDVEYLIAESIGDFSVAINSNSSPVLKSDLGIIPSQQELSHILIYEGRIDEKILKNHNISYDWIYEQLTINHIVSIDEVYLGIITPNKKLYINKWE